MFESIPHADLEDACYEQVAWLARHGPNGEKCYVGPDNCRECSRWRSLVDFLVYKGAWETKCFQRNEVRAYASAVGAALATIQKNKGS